MVVEQCCSDSAADHDNMTEAVALARARSLFVGWFSVTGKHGYRVCRHERAVSAVGLDIVDGHRAWASYRRFERNLVCAECAGSIGGCGCVCSLMMRWKRMVTLAKLSVGLGC